ncbi:MAG: sugar phosphate isomerase/epimerase [Acidobacteriota bacterium]|nr:sugar phosphate isomerase/epimerase [Acidobacteriota bacterium]
MTVFDWIEQARALPAQGLEMYEGFFPSLNQDYLDQVRSAVQDAGFQIPMLCCSPDFTHPDADFRAREVEREAELIRASHRLGGAGTVCRVLTGQRYPEVEREQGLEWVFEAIRKVLPVAQEYGVVLGLENHYKDGKWQYPEFAQKQDLFLQVVAEFRGNPAFGVQYDPSNALVAGDDPIALLEAVAGSVVSMHASDRHLAPDGTLQHGVTGKGVNDYPAIFSILARSGYRGWVSIEDGVNGMDEMRESLEFLHRMNRRYFPQDAL